MLPDAYGDELVQDFSIIEHPTLTYRLQFNGQPSFGMVNGIDAMKQAIFLALHTERFQYAVFSWNYGIERRALIGQTITPFLQAKIEQAIRDALLADDRILQVDSFQFEKMQKGVTAHFTVHTTQGDIPSAYQFQEGEIA